MKRASLPGRGFTLVELLAVVSIILVIVALVLVAMRAVANSARQTDSMNSVRQLAVAHSNYSIDHDGVIIPGFLNTTKLNDLDIDANAPSGVKVSAAAARTWVWRLSPYFSDGWEMLYRDFRDSSMVEKLNQQLLASDALPISTGPAFGLNTIFIGGDSDRGGDDVTDRSPWGSLASETIAATRVSRVKRPSQLILFTASTDANAVTANAPQIGEYEARAPFLVDPQWSLGASNTMVQETTLETPAGLPIARFGDQNLPLSYMDGSSGIVPLSSISVDMRMWAPFAEFADYRVP